MRPSRPLQAAVYAVTLSFMAAALWFGLTQGWATYIQFAGWLPKGTRIFAGYPYSILVFGAWALWAVRRYGWPGLFIVAFMNEVWELCYDLTPAVYNLQTCTYTINVPAQGLLNDCVQAASYYNPHYPLYLAQGTILALSSWLVFQRFVGNPFHPWGLAKTAAVFAFFCQVSSPWSYAWEFYGQVFLVFLFFVFRTPAPGDGSLWTRKEALGPKYYDREGPADQSGLAGRLVALASPRSALDVGCGRGHLVKALRSMGVEALGVDPNPYAVAHAVTPGVAVGDAVAGLRFPDGSFDMVVSVGVLQYVRPKERMLAEMRRVLRPGGWLFVCFEMKGAGQERMVRLLEETGFRLERAATTENEGFFVRQVLGRGSGPLSWRPLRRLVQEAFKGDYAFLLMRAIERVPLTVVIPAYNEGKTVGAVARACLPYGEVIVVDDGSADETYAEAVASGARVLRHPVNLGYSAAVKTGLREARGDAVALVDADGQMPAEELPSVADPILRGDADMVIGSKYTGRAEYRSRLKHAAANAVLTVYLNARFGVTLTHPFSGMRAMRRSCVDISELRGTHFESVMELDFTMLRRHYRVLEVPRLARARAFGSSHVSNLDGARIAWRFVQLAF